MASPPLPCCRGLLPAAGGCSRCKCRLQPAVAGGVLTDAPTARDSKLSYVPKSPKEMTRLQRRLAEAGFHGLPRCWSTRSRDRAGGDWIRDGVVGDGPATRCDLRRRRGGAGLHGARLHRRPPHPAAQEADRERPAGRARPAHRQSRGRSGHRSGAHEVCRGSRSPTPRSRRSCTSSTSRLAPASRASRR